MKKLTTLLIFLLLFAGCAEKHPSIEGTPIAETPKPTITATIQPTHTIEIPTETAPPIETEPPQQDYEIPAGKLLYQTRGVNILWLLDLPEMTQTALYSHEEKRIFMGEVFPGGEKFAFHLESDLYLGDIYSSEPELLMEDVGPFHISPDGTKIAFIREISVDNWPSFDIYIYDLETRTVNQITHIGKPFSGLEWSPDGHKIAFISNTSFDDSDLYIINSNGTDLALLLNEVSDYRGLSWASNSDLIAVPYTNDKKIDLKMIEISSNKVTEIPSPGKFCDFPLFIPKQNQIVFTCKVSGSWNLYSVDLVSGEFTALTHFDNASKEYTSIGLHSHFDDTYILFMYFEGKPTDKAYDLYLAPLTGAGIIQLTDGLNISSFSWYLDQE